MANTKLRSTQVREREVGLGAHLERAGRVAVHYDGSVKQSLDGVPIGHHTPRVDLSHAVYEGPCARRWEQLDG